VLLRQIFDPYLAQYAYLFGCPRTGTALVIDPERDIDTYRELAADNGLRITAVAETHIHADFVSGAREFAEDPNVHLYLSAQGGPDWQYQWTQGHPNVHVLRDGDRFQVGGLDVQAVYTPGHTPEHLSFLITDRGGNANQPMCLATGDFLFVGDVGRPDLLETAAGVKGVMESSAKVLQKSLHDRLTPFADYVQVLPAHGAGSACGKSLGAVPVSTLGYERLFNLPWRQARKDPAAFVHDILTGQPDPPLYFARMKKVNRDGIEVRGSVPTIPHMDRSGWDQAATQPGIRILDTRGDAVTFDQAHVKNAILAPLRSPFFSAAAGSFLDPADGILLVTSSAQEAELACRQLFRIGYDHPIGFVLFEEAKDWGLMECSIPRILFTKFKPAEALREGDIIDVRTTSEFQRGHIEGARSFPYTRMKTRLDELSRDRKLFIHCGSGRRAGLAASFLASKGFQPIHLDGICRECEKIAIAEGVAH
jgi:hydroxyacylglutathione hydrolase